MYVMKNLVTATAPKVFDRTSPNLTHIVYCDEMLCSWVLVLCQTSNMSTRFMPLDLLKLKAFYMAVFLSHTATNVIKTETKNDTKIFIEMRCCHNNHCSF